MKGTSVTTMTETTTNGSEFCKTCARYRIEGPAKNDSDGWIVCVTCKVNPSHWPHHEEFKFNRTKLETCRNFLEWLTDEAQLHKEPRFREFWEELRGLSDKDKERWIFEFCEMDLSAFYEEKEEMVRQLQENARRDAVLRA